MSRKAKDSKEAVSKVQAVLVPNEATYIPKTPEEFANELPAERDECMRSLVANVAYAHKQNSLRMWFVGKIIHTLQERGEENVFEQAMDLVKMKQRALYNCLGVFKAFPDPEYIADVGKLLEWTSVRKLLSVKSPEKRKEICDKVLAGTVSDDTLDTTVKLAVAEERKAKEKEKEEDPDADDTAGPKPKKINPAVVLQKLEDYFLRSVKNVQEYEAEYTEIMKLVWDPEHTEEKDFSEHMVIVERVVAAVKKLEKELKSTVPVYQKLLDNDPHKKVE